MADIQYVREDVNIQLLAAAKMLQHSRAMYSISYIGWLQLAAEYGGCSQLILTSPLILGIFSVFLSDIMSDVFSWYCLTTFHIHCEDTSEDEGWGG